MISGSAVVTGCVRGTLIAKVLGMKGSKEEICFRRWQAPQLVPFCRFAQSTRFSESHQSQHQK